MAKTDHSTLLNMVLESFLTYKGSSFRDILVQHWKQPEVSAAMVLFVRQSLQNRFRKAKVVEAGSGSDFFLEFDEAGAQEISDFLMNGKW